MFTAAADDLNTSAPVTSTATNDAPEAPPPVNDVGWMLVGYQSRFDPGGVFAASAEHLQGAHERLVQMPDDPAWARATEAKLRAYVAEVGAGAVELRSVTCRASGCEVQAIQLAPELAAAEAEGRLLGWPMSPKFEANPLPSLSMDASERAPLSDRYGVYLSYRRVDRDDPPGPGQSSPP